MSDSSDLLRWRREALLRRVERQRQALRGHMDVISGGLDRADRGLALVSRVATPPVLLAAGIAMTLLLGRGSSRKLLAAGLSVAGLLLRARSARQLLAGLINGQAVSRSR